MTKQPYENPETPNQPSNKPHPFDPTPDEIATARQMITACIEKEGRRSLDDERVFMEDLLVQRVNFLLVVFSIFVAAGFAANTKLLSSVVFFAGSVICFLMAKIVHRAHVKHHWIMRLFYKQPAPETAGELPHVIRFINEAMDKPERKRKSPGSVSTLVGVLIPRLCWSFLFVCGIVSAILFASKWYGPISGQVRSLLGERDGAVTYLSDSPKTTTTVLRGKVSYKLYDSAVEVTIIATNGTPTILVLPVDRLVSIER